MKRTASYVSAVLAVGLAAGSASGQAVVVLSHPVPGPTNGRLVGAIHRAGGPPDGGKLAGLVSVFNSRGHAVGRIDVRAGHDFRFRLPPGRYRLGLGRRLPTSRNLGGCRPTATTVRAGATTHHNLWYGCAYR